MPDTHDERSADRGAQEPSRNQGEKPANSTGSSNKEKARPIERWQLISATTVGLLAAAIALCTIAFPYVYRPSSLTANLTNYVVTNGGAMEINFSISNRGETDQAISSIAPIIVDSSGRATKLKTNLAGNYESIEGIVVKKGEVLTKKLRFNLPSESEYDPILPCVIPKAKNQVFKIGIDFSVTGSNGEINQSEFIVSSGSIDEKYFHISLFEDQLDLTTHQSAIEFSTMAEGRRKVTESITMHLQQPLMMSGDRTHWTTGLNPIDIIRFLRGSRDFDQLTCFQKGRI